MRTKKATELGFSDCFQLKPGVADVFMRGSTNDPQITAIYYCVHEQDLDPISLPHPHLILEPETEVYLVEGEAIELHNEHRQQLRERIFGGPDLPLLRLVFEED